MREIKFRAWDIEAKQMFYELIYVIKENSLLDINGFFKNDNIVPMQCTGQKDKNGKEIWEGDVLKSDEEDPLYYEVYWDNNLMGFNLFWEHEFIQVANYDWSLLIIIGNIYENPELRVIKNE